MCSYAGNEYVGIIQNRDLAVTTIYDFGSLTTDESKKQFLDLGATWWWESNHSIPINVFLGKEWDFFKNCQKTFSNKDLLLLHGPVCSLAAIAKHKTKRRSITLVRAV